MADQEYTAKLSVTDSSSSILEQIRAVWVALKEAIDEGKVSAADVGRILDGIVAPADGTTSSLQELKDAFTLAGVSAQEIDQLFASLGGTAESVAGSLDIVSGAADGATGAVDTLAGSESEAASTGEELSASLDQVANSAERVQDSAGGASESLKEVKQSGDGAGDALGGLGSKAGIAGAGIEMVTDELLELAPSLTEVAGFIYENTEAWARQEAQIDRVALTLRNNVKNWDGDIDAIERAISKRMELRFADDQLREGLMRFAVILKDDEKAWDALGVSMDFARGQNKSLEQSANILARAMLTGGQSLSRYGVEVREGATATEVLAAVQAQYAGQAQLYADSNASAFDRLGIAMDEFKEQSGAPFAEAGAGVLNVLSRVVEDATEFGAGLQEGLNSGFESAKATVGEFRTDLENEAPSFGEAGVASGEGYSEGVVTALSDRLGDVSDQAQQVVDATDKTSESSEVGIAVGEAHGSAHAGGIAGLVGAVSQAASAAVAATDKSGASGNVGAKVGNAYSVNMINKVNAGIAAAQAKIDAFAAAANAAVPGLNLPRVGSAGQGRASSSTWLSYEDYQGMNEGIENVRATREPTGTGISPAEEAANRHRREQDYIGKYGVDPQTGLPAITEAQKNAEATAERAERDAKQAERAAKSASGGGGGKGKTGKTGGGGPGKTQAERDAEKAATDLDRAENQIDSAKGTLEDLAATEELNTAKAELKDRQEDLNAVTDRYNTLIGEQEDKLDALKTSEKNVTAPLINALEDARSELGAMQDASEEALHGFDVKIHDATEQLRFMKETAAYALAPFADDVKEATAALDAVNEKIKQTGKELSVMKQHYQDLYTPLNDQLYELGQAEKAALDPLDKSLYNQQLRLQAMGDELDAIAAKYDTKLVPLQSELNKLMKEEASISRDKELQNLGQTATNLEAQLRNAKEGSAQAAQLKKDLAEAQGTLGRRTTQYGLEDRIGAITEDKDEALKAQQAEIDAAERRMELMAREREARAHSFQEERAVIEERRALLERQEELATRDIEARQRVLEGERDTAEAAVKSADDELERQQQIWDARQKNIDDYIKNLSHERTERAWTDSEAERLKNQEIARMDTTLKATQQSYKDRRTEIDEYIGKLQDEGEQEEATAKVFVDEAKKKVEGLSEAISAANFDERKIDTWNKLADGFDKAAKAVGESSPKYAEYATQADAARAKAAELAGTMNTDLPPASTAMTGALDRMLKEGLVPLRDELDPAKERSFQWLFDKAWTPDKDGSNERDWGYSFHQMGFAAQQMTGVVDFVLHDNFKRWDALFEKPKKWADDWEDAFERMQNATGGGGGGDDKQPFKETDPFGGTPPLTKNHDPFSRGVTPQTDRTRTQVRVPVAVQHVGTIDQRVYVQLPDGMTELPKTVQGWMAHIRNIRAASRRFEKSGH